ncbi:hypothetical protein ANCDUO_00016 [Ancylostoma duodenale]|uniref:Uncharacterized protein n=1 Tax=Ancylostoma duodenale TaxID=51022 RepID=A0A0C2H6X9_9BILA|nr:hypothetical protein ANCDUO_00016 [Ancylostoma duodenale]
MNRLILLCLLQVVTGFFFIPQVTPTMWNRICFGNPKHKHQTVATASVVSRVRSPLNGVAHVLVQPVGRIYCPPSLRLYKYNALGFMPLEASYAVTNFPPYHPPQLPRLSLSYDFVTPLPPMPPPPMTVPLDGQYSMPMRSVALPSFTNDWPAPRPLYIQVPASSIKSEGNDRSATEKLLPTTDMEEKLHSAESPPGPPSTPLPTPSRPAFTLQTLTTKQDMPTTTIPPEEGDNEPAPIPIPSLSKPINNEPELGFSFTPSLEDLETTSVTIAVDDNVPSVTSDNAKTSDYGQNDENLPEYLSNSLDPVDSTTTTTVSESTTTSSVAERRPRPLLVETTHIEVYHPQGESFTESTERSTLTTTSVNVPNEIEITASQGDPPGYAGKSSAEDVPSHPLPPAVNAIHQRASYQIQAPYSPPRTKPMKNEIFKVRFSGYETKSEEPYAAAPSRNGSTDLLERSTVSCMVISLKYCLLFSHLLPIFHADDSEVKSCTNFNIVGRAIGTEDDCD